MTYQTEDDGPTYRVAEQGDPMFDRTTALVDVFREALAVVTPTPDHNDLITAMTAACVFAGTLAGTLIGTGLLRDQDKRRLVKNMEHNFRQGIDIGKRRALNIAAEQFGGTA